MKKLNRIMDIISFASNKANVNRGTNDDMVFVNSMNTDIVIGITNNNEGIHLSIPIFKLVMESCVSDTYTIKLVYRHGDMADIYRTILIKTCKDCEDEVEVLMYEREKGREDNQLMKYFITSLSNVNLSIVK